MKKIILLIMVFALIFGGCSQNNSEPKQTSNSTGTESKEKAKTDFPQKPIQIIVPFAPGGTTDIAGRIVGEAAKKYLPNDQPIVIVNKPGAGGVLGVGETLKSSPDGYTIGLTMGDQLMLSPLVQSTPYKHDEFEAIAGISIVPIALVVHKDSPWKTFEQWLDYVKKNPNKFTMAVPGKNTANDVMMTEINMQLGIKTKQIPYEGAAPATNALLGKQANGLLTSVSSVGKYIQSGDFVALTYKKGSATPSYLKDIPSMDKLGLDVKMGVYVGIIGPKGIPQDVLTMLQDAFKKALAEPEVVEKLEKAQLPVDYKTPEDYKKTILDAYQSTEKTLKSIGAIK